MAVERAGHGLKTPAAHGLKCRRGRTVRRDAAGAVADLVEQIGQPGLSAVLFFAHAGMDFDALAAGMADAFVCPTMGCTTAGEICDEGGLGDGSVVAVSLASGRLAAHASLLEGAETGDLSRVRQETATLMDRRVLGPGTGSFILTLCDGLSMCEEQLAAGVFAAAGGCGMVGGSAGGGMDMKSTKVALDGRTTDRGAVVCVVETDHPFEIFHSHHFEPSARRLVITAADPATRRVLEIDGLPAAEGYARAIGAEAGSVGTKTFASRPLMLMIDGGCYLRSVMAVNAGGSLTFACAVDTGLVLRVGEPGDLAGILRSQVDGLRARVPDLAVTLGFDCVLRRVEIMGRGLEAGVAGALRDAKMVGFSTFGEQFNGLHVNQTLTGVAIGGAA